VSIRYSDLEGGQASIFMGSGSSLDWGGGMIDADPLFADELAGDYHLLYTSPCRDAGDSSVPDLPDTDFEGDPRIESGVVDMGADEFSDHLYWTGEPEPGEPVEVKVTGMPFKKAILFVGQDILDPPKETRHGYWYLKLPVTPVIMGKFTLQGIVKIRGRIPPGYPAPCSLPMQGAIRMKLTNLSVLQITP
jgi:hypothetical protein